MFFAADRWHSPRIFSSHICLLLNPNRQPNPISELLRISTTIFGDRDTTSLQRLSGNSAAQGSFLSLAVSLFAPLNCPEAVGSCDCSKLGGRPQHVITALISSVIRSSVALIHSFCSHRSSVALRDSRHFSFCFLRVLPIILLIRALDSQHSVAFERLQFY